MNALNLLSHLQQDKNYPEVTLTEFRGILNLHLGTDWIQGGMRLTKPTEIVFDYVQDMMAWMLFNDHPRHIVQFGLGAASLTKFCYAVFPDSQITAIELNPNVIAACKTVFHLPDNNNRLTVIQADAIDVLSSWQGKKQIDILQIDLYDDQAQAPVFDSISFFQQCANILSPQGILIINIFGEQANQRQTIANMQACFDAVVWLPEVDGGNTVAMAFQQSPAIDFETLYKKAETIRHETRLKATHWVNGLYAWMEQTFTQ